MIRSLGNMVYEESMKELGLFNLKRRWSENLVTVLKYPKSNYWEEGDVLFSVAAEGRTRTNGFKLQQRKFRNKFKH